MAVENHKHIGTDAVKIKLSNIENVTVDSDDVVNLTGDETVAGIKTFTSIPVLPASDPTADNEAVRKKYVDDNKIDSTVTETDDYLIDSADTERSIVSAQTVYTEKKQIDYKEANGTIRVKFDIKDGNGAGTTYGRVYINDVAVGVERTETAGTWTTFSEDFSVSTEDEVSLKMKHGNEGGSNGGSCRNFRLYYYKKIDITAGTVNQD